MSLTCRSLAGSPEPRVVWKRVAEPGRVVAGPVLSWSAVNRQAAGRYACDADNGFGPSPVRQEVELQVHCKYMYSKHSLFGHPVFQYVVDESP